MSVTERIALITGAGTGIGRAVSLALAESGWVVVLTGRRQQPIASVCAEIASRAGRGEAIVADVADPAAVRDLFARIRGTHGRLDLLFNNAGASGRTAPLEELTPEEWRFVIDVNLNGAFFCAQQAVHLMKTQNPRGGRIINNGSLAATTPRPHTAAYTASKHAISGLTKAIALEGRAFDIACGQIDIGNAATAIGSHASQGALQPDGSRRIEPMLDLSAVADAVRYMAGLPLDANVLSLTVMATKMPFVGRG